MNVYEACSLLMAENMSTPNNFHTGFKFINLYKLSAIA